MVPLYIGQIEGAPVLRCRFGDSLAYEVIGVITVGPCFAKWAHLPEAIDDSKALRLGEDDQRRA